jgi:hypothetical protein
LLLRRGRLSIPSSSSSLSSMPSNGAVEGETVLQVRDVESFPEPIAFSYLHYSLRKIQRPVAHSDEASRRTNDTERQLSLLQLMDLVSGKTGSPSVGQPSAADSAALPTYDTNENLDTTLWEDFSGGFIPTSTDDTWLGTADSDLDNLLGTGERW